MAKITIEIEPEELKIVCQELRCRSLIKQEFLSSALQRGIELVAALLKTTVKEDTHS